MIKYLITGFVGFLAFLLSTPPEIVLLNANKWVAFSTDIKNKVPEDYLTIAKYFLWVSFVALITLLPKNIKFKRISWLKNQNFLAFNSFRKSQGFSEDIVIYSDPEYRIQCFQFKGRNNWKKPIEIVNGFIQSTKTNIKFPILLDSMNPEETYGIPGYCDFTIRAIFPNSTTDNEGYSIEDFWRHLGEFVLNISFDKKVTKIKFSKEAIETLLARMKKETEEWSVPKDLPRVKRKL